MASASEIHTDDYDDQDDSDMYMEPDGAGTAHEEATQENVSERTETATSSSVSVSQRNPSGEEIRVSATISQPRLQPDGEIVVTSAARQVDDKSLETDSQNFFPSFAELFANHRLPYNEQQQQQRYRPNRFLGYFQRDRSAYQTAASNTKDTQHPLLGSGNFGVIRGGTYYPEDKENEEYSGDESLYNPYYAANAPRGRANYYRNPKPQPIRGGDFFANFRDFADITAPPKSSFSHLSVVYANRNGTKGHSNEPRNIIETLRMLEEQDDETDIVNGVTTTTAEPPTKKLSQGKRKLIMMKKYHEDKARKSRMTLEPLLALSWTSSNLASWGFLLLNSLC